MIKDGKLICVWCGKKIPKDSGWAEFCSAKCEEIASRVRYNPKPSEPEKLERRRIIRPHLPDKPSRSYLKYVEDNESHRKSMIDKYGAPPGAKPPTNVPNHHTN